MLLLLPFLLVHRCNVCPQTGKPPPKGLPAEVDDLAPFLGIRVVFLPHLPGNENNEPNGRERELCADAKDKYGQKS